MADNEKPLPQRGVGNPNPQLVNGSKLKTIFSNRRADISVFYGHITKDSVTPKFMFDSILITKTIYHWSDTASARNF
jgi:hypothetical protein